MKSLQVNLLEKLGDKMALILRLFACVALCIVPGHPIYSNIFSGADQSDCESSDQNPEEVSSDRKYGCVIGGMALATAAGALAGVGLAHGKHGHSGNDGPIGNGGETGADGTEGVAGASGTTGSAFIKDEDRLLIFNFDLKILSLPDEVTIIVYVTLPDGTTRETDAVLVTETGTIPLFITLVNNPPFGSYTVGLQIFGTPLGLSLTFEAFAAAIRDGSSTSLILPPPLFVTATQAQTSINFVYDPLNVP